MKHHLGKHSHNPPVRCYRIRCIVCFMFIAKINRAQLCLLRQGLILSI